LTARLEILDQVSDPAKPEAENDDRIGWNESAAFVIDGATGLGDPVVAPPASDAAWLAEHARRYLETHLMPERDIGDVVRELCTTAAEAFFRAAGSTALERYRYPNAAFQVLRVTARGIETAGLADCTLILRDADSHLHRHRGTSAKRGNEQDSARRAIAQSGGFNAAGESFRASQTLDELRQKRAGLNSDPNGMWTLGVVPATGAHVRSEMLAIRLPAVGVLCTDGFADLVDNYRACSAEGLIARAQTDGLRALLEELRHIERLVDPDGAQFPRYKRCDDASAVLVRLI
jgi:serine/threonine protein phosphatase PrpC